MAERAAHLAADPDADMWERPRAHAKYQTFQAELGRIGRYFLGLRGSIPGAALVVPFIRTPANIFKYAAERTPFGLLMKDVRDNLGGKNGRVAADTQRARMLLGTAVGVGIVAMVAEGLISGNGPDDPKRRELMMTDGWQPYSVRVGDTWLQYSRLDPLGLLVGIAADLAELGPAIESAQADRIGAVIVAAVAQNIFNKTYLSGLADFVEAVNDPQRYADSYLRRFAGSLIPAGVAHLAQAIDPNLRDARDILDRLRSRLPGLSDRLPAQVDVFGEPIAREGGGAEIFASPIKRSIARDDPVIAELLRLRIGLRDPAREIRGAPLSPELYEEYGRTAGRLTKNVLARLIGSGAYRQMSDGIRLTILRRAVARVRETARRMLLAAHPEIMQEIGKLKAAEVTAPAAP